MSMTIRSGHNTYTQMHTSSSSFVKLWKCVLHMHVATLVPRMLHPLLSSTPAYHILLTLKYPNKHVTFLNTLFPELFSISLSLSLTHTLSLTLCLPVFLSPTGQQHTASAPIAFLSVCLSVFPSEYVVRAEKSEDYMENVFFSLLEYLQDGNCQQRVV